MDLSVLAFATLFLLWSAEWSTQTQERVSPLHTNVSIGCKNKSGICHPMGNIVMCINATSFDVDQRCVLMPYFRKKTNEVRIASTKSQSITIESFVLNSSNASWIIFTSSEAVQTLTINITSTAELSDIKYFLNTDFSATTPTVIVDSSNSTIDEITHSSTPPATPTTTTTTSNIVLTVIVVAVVLGLLLLLVACALFGLTFAVVIHKKKGHSQSPLRIHSMHSNPPNMYEASMSSLGDGFKKVGKGTVTMERPKTPTDPEYATLSEWKDMTEKPVHNPFYDSSMSLEAKKGAAAVQVPQLEWSGSAWDASSPTNNCEMLSKQQQFDHPFQSNRRIAFKSNSLQDMRSHSVKTSQRDEELLLKNSIRMKNLGNHGPPPLPSTPPPPRDSSLHSSTPSETPKSVPSAHPPFLSSPPPAPSSARPPLPPSNKKKILLKHSGPGSSSVNNMAGVPGKNFASGNNNTGMSPLVQHDLRATDRAQANEIINSDYGITGMKHLQQVN